MMKEKLYRTGYVEHRKMRKIPLAQLVRDNPTINKISETSYANLFPFDLDRLDPPHYARVLDRTDPDNPVVRFKLVDGNHRIRLMWDYNGKPLDGVIYDFSLVRVNNVTSALMRNNKFVYVSERKKGQKVLTMLQYLRALTYFTIVHEDIASARMAAHLINAWESLSGEKIAEKFSTLSALALVTNPQAPLHDKEAFRKFLDEQGEFFTGETLALRERALQALTEMAEIVALTMSESTVTQQEILASAFALVASETEVIGGAQKGAKEIYGLLFHPILEEKLKVAFPKRTARETARTRLAEEILLSIDKVHERDRRSALEAIVAALKDRRMTLDHIQSVVQSDNPQTTRDEIHREFNRQLLEGRYRSNRRRRTLTETETALIRSLGTQSHLEEEVIAACIPLIEQADHTVAQSQGFRIDLETNRKSYLSAGVRGELLDESVVELTKLESEFTASTSIIALKKRIPALTDALGETDKKIKFQMALQRVGRIFDALQSEKLEGAGVDLRYRGPLIAAIIQETDGTNREVVERLLLHFQAINNSSLRDQVLLGNLTITQALEIQLRPGIQSREAGKKLSIKERNEILAARTGAFIASDHDIPQDERNLSVDNRNALLIHLRQMRSHYPEIFRELEAPVSQKSKRRKVKK